jgi:hypothetical protein
MKGGTCAAIAIKQSIILLIFDVFLGWSHEDLRFAKPM